MKQEIPWNRFAIEAIVIVGSILLAFAIDAWWESRTQDQNELRLLSSFQSELQQAREGLNAHVIQLNQDIETISLSIEGLATSEIGVTPQEEINNLASLFVPNLEFTVPRAVLNNLLNAGAISVITSDELKVAISEYDQLVELLEVVQDRLSDLWLNYLAPYRYQYGAMGGLNLPGVETKFLEWDAKPEAFVKNQYFQNLLMARNQRTRDVIQMINRVNDQIDNLLQPLASE